MILSNVPQIRQIISGIAYGDSMGLPWENIKPGNIPVDRQKIIDYAAKMVSDDTEHALFTLSAVQHADEATFAVALRERFNRWICGFPPSLGGATLRSGLRSFLRFRSPGVDSQGNGPLVRAAVLGAIIDDAHLRERLVDISTTLTHDNSLARSCARLTAEFVSSKLQRRVVVMPSGLGIWLKPMDLALSGASREAMKECGLLDQDGVSGHAPVTLAMALHIATQYTDMQDAVLAMIACGGDADSTSALVGAFSVATGQVCPPNWEVSVDDMVWSQIAPDIMGGGDWPQNLGAIRRRNFKQLCWGLQLMVSSRLKARLS